MEKFARIALVGDVMLGRTVDARFRTVGDHASVWGDALDYLRGADATLINLECVITGEDTGSQWQSKVFHFKAQPWAIAALKAAGVDAVSLANNHVLDYHEDALQEMISLLDQAEISHSGAGDSLTAASRPAIVTSRGLRVALLAVTDNEPRWEATHDKPGIVYVPLTGGVRFARLVRSIREAKTRVDVVVVSAHVGPHMREKPSGEYVSFARAILDAGADIYMGTSNHSFQGIGIYNRKPILYDLGDFVDDYAIDAQMRNDWSFLFLVEVDGSRLRSLSMIPTVISNLQVNLARGEERELIITRMRQLCNELGTETRRKDDLLEISLE